MQCSGPSGHVRKSFVLETRGRRDHAKAGEEEGSPPRSGRSSKHPPEAPPRAPPSHTGNYHPGFLWSTRIQLTIKLRIKKGILFQTEDSNPGSRFSEALSAVLLLEVQGTVIHISETKDRMSEGHAGILHKVHQGYTVPVARTQRAAGHHDFLELGKTPSF